jgi:hypothetical protein
LSTGPKTAGGKQRSSKNSLKHGLAVPVRDDPCFGPFLDNIAGFLTDTEDDQISHHIIRAVAETEAELARLARLRYRYFAEAQNGRLELGGLAIALEKLARYERRAYARRKRIGRT